MTEDDVVVVTPTESGTYVARINALGVVVERETEGTAREDAGWAIAAMAETPEGRAQLLASPLGDRFADRWRGSSRRSSADGRAALRRLLQGEQPVLLYFWAPWCRPCKTIAPAVQTLADHFAGRLQVVKLDVERPDVDDAGALATELQVLGLPTLIGFAGGEERIRLCGGISTDRLRDEVTSFVEASSVTHADGGDHE